MFHIFHPTELILLTLSVPVYYHFLYHSQVEVTNCFAVPHAERGSEVAIGKDFNRQMLALHLRANRNETVVGWYATSFPEAEEGYGQSQCIADTSTLIHEFYADECADTVMDAPIHLVVDTSLISDTIGV